MRSPVFFLGFCLSILLSACAMWRPKPPEPVVTASPEAKYLQPELDSLMSLADTLLKASSTERLAECEHILMLTNSEHGVGVNLHLYVAQLLTDACGDIHETWERVKAGKSEIQDRRVLSFLALMEQLQNRYDEELAHRTDLEKQLKQTSKQAVTTKRQIKNRESELKELQDKLDALKDIEQNLGSKQGGH